MLDAVLAFILALRWPVTDDGCPIIPLPMPRDVFVTDEPCGCYDPCVADADNWRDRPTPAQLMAPVTKLAWPEPKEEVVPVTLPSLEPVEPVVPVYRTFIITDAAGKRLGMTQRFITVSRRSWVALHGELTDEDIKDLEQRHVLLQDFFTVCAEPL